MLEMVKDSFNQILASYSQYKGIGMFMILFFASLLYIYIHENAKTNRTLLLYFPVIALVAIFNPLIADRIISVIHKEVYWRMFWILPITIVIAYVATAILLSMPKRSKKAIVLIALSIIIIMSGKFIYTKENYDRSSNWYKLPAQTIEVCEILKKDATGQVRVVVPDDLEVSVRQYDANIELGFGRAGNAFYSDEKEAAWASSLHAIMHRDILDLPAIVEAMNVLKCNYIVLHKDAVLSGSIGEYGYHCVASTDSYNIYSFNYDEITAIY